MLRADFDDFSSACFELGEPHEALSNAKLMMNR